MILENKNIEYKINPERLRFLIDLYKLSNEEFLSLLKGKNIKPVLTSQQLESVLHGKLKVSGSVIKKIDSVFERGLTWYISKRDLPGRENLSVFFRKDKFNSELNLGAIKKIEEYEKIKAEIDSMCSYINYNAERKMQYSLKHDPKEVAAIVRQEFLKQEIRLNRKSIFNSQLEDRKFLEGLIRLIEEFNVFVFEFVDLKKKEELRSAFNGFYIRNNLIVIKRQDYFKREIFTLMHEFGHYLIDKEEIDKITGEELIDKSGDIEKWCNDFAYYFLSGNYDTKLKELSFASIDNDFHEETVKEIAFRTHLSSLALYTRMRINDKISYDDYERIKKDTKRIMQEIKESNAEELKHKKQLAELKGETYFIPPKKPIESKLYKELIKINYFEGNISESKLIEVCSI
jgi:Zn-dependent peptidase ImmA (M78 family)